MDKIEITDGLVITVSFNDFFVDIGPKVASKITQSNNCHAQYIHAASSLLQNITVNEE